jgi:hypothetical protein
MLRAPTRKSRLIARTGLVLVACGMVLDAWLRPPVPQLSAIVFSVVSVGMMQWAKQVRESDGQQIPESVVKSGAAVANIEAIAAVFCGLCVFAILAGRESGASKHFQRWETAASLFIFLGATILYAFTRAKFDALMKLSDAK